MPIIDLVDAIVPAVLEELDSTGHAGHCILVAKVLNQVLSAAGVVSLPMCVDYEVLNPAALKQIRNGGDVNKLTGDAFAGRTGTGGSGMYDHHVVTVIPQGATAILLDPAIVQVARTIPGTSLPPLIITDLPYPPTGKRGFVIQGHNVTYTFRPETVDFMLNEQWANEEAAAAPSSAVIQRLGLERPS